MYSEEKTHLQQLYLHLDDLPWIIHESSHQGNDRKKTHPYERSCGEDSSQHATSEKDGVDTCERPGLPVSYLNHMLYVPRYSLCLGPRRCTGLKKAYRELLGPVQRTKNIHILDSNVVCQGHDWALDSSEIWMRNSSTDLLS